jgi:hypothetical protein
LDDSRGEGTERFGNLIGVLLHVAKFTTISLSNHADVYPHPQVHYQGIITLLGMLPQAFNHAELKPLSRDQTLLHIAEIHHNSTSTLSRHLPTSATSNFVACREIHQIFLILESD